VTSAVTGTLQETTGTPGYDPGYDPTRKTNATSALLSNGETEALSSFADGTSAGYSYPPPQTTFFVLEDLYGKTDTPYPYKVIGKVFFVEEDGENNYCSGASIGGRAVLTAGHCVSNEKGTYYTHWIFVPAYNNGEAPYGKWTASSFLTFDSLHNGGNLGRDVAFAIVKNPQLPDEKLSKKVGYLGFAYNLSVVQHWNMFGYPVTSPWKGNRMIETDASYASSDTTKTPNTPGMGTTQLGGCSGGPWIVNFAPGVAASTSNLASGVNSYSTAQGDYEIFTPYFDDSVKAMKDEAVAK
jgi:secreted trypsin-like serine protease